MPSGKKDNSNSSIKARCIHASRLPEYRLPFGARPAASGVDIFFDCYKDASNVTFCYTYGLYTFSYHEEPMYSVSGTGRYHVELMLPFEPSILAIFLARFLATAAFSPAATPPTEAETEFAMASLFLSFAPARPA